MSLITDAIAGEDRELFARSLGHATESSTGKALDDALAELGWADALTLDQAAAVSLLFEFQGASNAVSSALETVVRHALGDDVERSVVLPPIGRTTAPGDSSGDRTVVDGLGLAGFGDRETALVATGSVVLAVPTSALEVTPAAGIDPGLGLVRVSGTVTREVVGEADWEDGLAAGHRAVAHELIGAAHAMLQLARDHAVDRIQFDRPIAMFQAIRHKLAECHVAVESARAAADASWREGSPFAASVAKAVAARNARLVAKHAQQVLAGIGFTTEHAFHHHLKRVLVLEALLGDPATLSTQMGRQFLADRTLPAVLPL